MARAPGPGEAAWGIAVGYGQAVPFPLGLRKMWQDWRSAVLSRVRLRPLSEPRALGGRSSGRAGTRTSHPPTFRTVPLSSTRYTASDTGFDTKKVAPCVNGSTALHPSGPTDDVEVRMLRLRAQSTSHCG